MPNFILFGAIKSATSSIYQYLEQHPDICMSSIKEPGFFAFEGEKPILNGPGRQEWVDNGGIINELESYQKLFENYSGEKAIGEASPFYICYEKCIVTLKKYTPNVKLIAVLRNPADRAFSQYVWARRDGLEDLKHFQDALAAEESRIEKDWALTWHYKKLGFYYHQLKPYFESFPSKQIKICLYENFVNDPNLFMQDIFDFLEVDTSFTPDMSHKYNLSVIPRNNFWHHFLKNSNPVKSIIKPFLPSNFRRNLKIKAKQKNLFKPSFSPKIRQQLMSEYKEDILKLQELTKQDFSVWIS